MTRDYICPHCNRWVNRWHEHWNLPDVAYAWRLK